MAKDTQVLMSRWLLLGAACLAVVAAVAVNLYISSVTSQYEREVIWVVQVKKEVPQGGKVNPDDLDLVRVPKVFEAAFAQAFTDNKDWFVGGRPSRRKLNKGDLLFHGDFQDVQKPPEPVKPPAGYEYINLPIARESTPGAQLQPEGFVSVRGRFNVTPNQKDKQWATLSVFECIQVKTLDDSTSPLPKEAASYSRIGVFVKKDQAALLSDIISQAEGRRLFIGITGAPAGRVFEPEINPQLAKLIQGAKTGVVPEIELPPE